ncbi:hypothetical protein SBADM41S_00545 [Streptomyces badius]
MLISGAVAGLAGMPTLLGDTHTYNPDFPTGIGFTGITIALLGRNNPLGIAPSALLIAFLDKSSASLDQYGYEKEIATIMQGLIVISVVAPTSWSAVTASAASSRRSARSSPPDTPSRPRRRRPCETSKTIAARPAPKKGKDRRKLSLPVVLLIIAGGLALVSLVRVISGADDITSVGQVRGALALAVPIGLAGLGGLWAERAGVINIGLEGMMILGTWFGAWAGFQWGPWVGVLFGILGGCLGGLLHAVITVTFGVNHIVSGVAINILAVGVPATSPTSPSTASRAAPSSPRASIPSTGSPFRGSRTGCRTCNNSTGS